MLLRNKRISFVLLSIFGEFRHYTENCGKRNNRDPSVVYFSDVSDDKGTARLVGGDIQRAQRKRGSKGDINIGFREKLAVLERQKSEKNGVKVVILR